MDLFSLVMLALAPVVLVWLWLADVIRPGSMARLGSRRNAGHVPALGWLAAAIGLLLAQTLGASLALPLAVMAGPEGSAAYAAILGVGAYSAALIAAAGLVLFLDAPRAGTGHGATADDTTNRSAGLRGRASDLLIGPGLMLLILPVIQIVGIASALVYQWTSGRPVEPIAHDTLKLLVTSAASPWAWLLGVQAVVAAPIVEELIFRGLLQSAIARARLGRWAAVVLAAGAFAAMHTSVPIYALPGLFVLGVALGIAFERTGRIGVPIAMHAAFNAGNMAVALAMFGAPNT